MRRKKVILADDHALIRSGLRRQLELAGGVSVVAEAKTGSELLMCLDEHRCDLVVVDLAMPEMNGLEALAVIRERFPALRCVVLSGFPDYATQARRLGVVAYLLKSEPAERVADVVRSILQGGPGFFSAGVGNQPAEDAAHLASAGEPAESPGILSARELQVLRLVAQGLKHREIAERLNVVERTVEFHKHNIKQKLRLHSNALLVQYAVQRGIA